MQAVYDFTLKSLQFLFQFLFHFHVVCYFWRIIFCGIPLYSVPESGWNISPPVTLEFQPYLSSSSPKSQTCWMMSHQASCPLPCQLSTNRIKAELSNKAEDQWGFRSMTQVLQRGWLRKLKHLCHARNDLYSDLTPLN